MKDRRLVIVEAVFTKDEQSLDDDDRAVFHEMIAAPPSEEAKKLGEVKLDDTWDLVIAPIEEDLTSLAAPAKKKSSKFERPCGAAEQALLVSVDMRFWDVLLEPPVEGSWGRGRRCVLVPTAV